MTNSEFQKDFKVLKNSEENYVFNGSDERKAGTGSFSYDGDQLFINYSFNKEKDKNSGLSMTGSLSHETRYEVQFENGKIGFTYNESAGSWNTENSDLYDEVDAFNAQFYKGYNHNGDFSLTGDPTTFRKRYNDAPNEPESRFDSYCKRNIIKVSDKSGEY